MNQYFEQMILSASPVEIVCLLYKRAIRSVRDAREHLKAGQILERTKAINHAWMVLLEEMLTTDGCSLAARSAKLSGAVRAMAGALAAARIPVAVTTGAAATLRAIRRWRGRVRTERMGQFPG